MSRELHKHFQSLLPITQAPLAYNHIVGIIVGSCLIGILWALWNFLQIRKIRLDDESFERSNDRLQIQSVKDIGFKIHEVTLSLFREPKNFSNRNTLSVSSLWPSCSLLFGA